MRTTSIAWGSAILAAAALASTAAAAPAPPDSLHKQALELNKITGDDVELGKIYELIEDAPHTKPLLAEAAKMAQEKDPPFNINAALILARTAQLLRDSDDAVVFYKLFIEQAAQLKSAQKIGEGYSGLIKALYDGGKFDESEKACQEFLSLKGDAALQGMKPAVLRQMVLVLAKEGKTEKASDLMDKIIQAQPDNPLNQIAKGQFLRLIEKPADAVKAYEAAIDLIKKDDDLNKEQQDGFVNEIRYTLSGLHMEMNDVDKAAADLKELLQKEPDNPGYNNDLGYIWADHDMNLPESEKMIRKALDEDRKQRLKANPDAKPEDVKDNPSYLDSLGWVLYKEKKYQEARVPLEQAVKGPDGQSVEIFDHLGEVLKALGDKEGAVSAWKKGVELPAETKHEKEKKAEVEKKLKENQ
jgi:tetratricopeptide (TPR) repeat protein